MGGIRTVTVALGIGFASLAIAQDQAQEINYETSASTLKIALEAISKQGGTPMLVSGALGDEIVTLRLKGASRAEFEKRLAATFRAEWQSESGGIRLIRSSQIQRQLNQEHFDRKLANLTKLIEAKKKELAGIKALTEADIGKVVAEVDDFMRRGQEDSRSWETLQKIQKSFPSQRLMDRILTLLDVKRLAAMESSDRYVFSTSPNSMQLPLPKEIGPLVFEAMKEQARLGESIRGVVPEDGPHSWMFDSFFQTASNDQVAKTLVIASKSQWGEGHNFEVRVVNQKGKYVFNGNSYLQNSIFEGAEELFNPKPGDNLTKEEPLPQSDIQKVISDFMKKSMVESGGRPGAIPPELKAILLDPVKHEPIGFSFGDYAIQLAARENKQLIAHPNDFMAMFGFYATMGEPPTPTRLRKVLTAGFMKTQVTESGAWIQIAPIDEIESQRDFLPRKFYTLLVQRLGRPDKVRLDEWAELAASFPEDPSQKPLFMFAQIINMDSAGDMMGPNLGWNRLRFYGLLTPAQRQALASKRFLTYGSLTAEQREAVFKIVFKDEPNLEPQPAMVMGGDQDEESADLMYNSVLNEVTEQLPNGIPMVSQITMESSDQSGYFIDYSSQGYSSSMFGNVDTIAWHIFQKENPNEENTHEQTMVYDKFTLGAQRNLNFNIKLTRETQKQWSLQDELRPDKSKAVTFDQLPENVRAEIRKKVDEIKKNQQDPPVSDPPPP